MHTPAAIGAGPAENSITETGEFEVFHAGLTRTGTSCRFRVRREEAGAPCGTTAAFAEHATARLDGKPPTQTSSEAADSAPRTNTAHHNSVAGQAVVRGSAQRARACASAYPFPACVHLPHQHLTHHGRLVSAKHRLNSNALGNTWLGYYPSVKVPPMSKRPSWMRCTSSHSRVGFISTH